MTDQPPGACHGRHAPPSAPPPADAQEATGCAAFTREMRRAMDAMMAAMHRDAPSGDADRDFLTMMIPHHQGAIHMARLVLQSGRDPLVRSLAEEIIGVQTSEIAGMQGRLAALRLSRGERCERNRPQRRRRAERARPFCARCGRSP